MVAVFYQLFTRVNGYGSLGKCVNFILKIDNNIHDFSLYIYNGFDMARLLTAFMFIIVLTFAGKSQLK